MKQTFSFVFLGMVLFVTGFTSCASGPAVKPARTSVWKISKKGNTIFLGGSIYLLQDENFPLPLEFDRAFAQSSLLVLEADTERILEPALANYLVAQMTLPEGKTLQSILAPEVYSQLRAKCAEFGLPDIGGISRYKPSMIINTLSTLQYQRFEFIQKGVDAYYLEKAKKTGKSVHFLEAIEEQITGLVGMGDGYENDYVRYSMDKIGNTKQNIVSLVSEWQYGKTALFETALAKTHTQWPAVYEKLILDKNTTWLPQIEGYLLTEPVEFVIIDLLHLHGNDGLLRQLAASGCTIEQIAPY
jgi:uncharacterized protein YbaP (TraB family)